MGVAYYTIPERETAGIDCEVNGKPIAHVRPAALRRVSQEAGVRVLTEFISYDPNLLQQYCDEHGIEPQSPFAAEEWFDAADGLRTVRALLARSAELAASSRGYVDEQGMAVDLRRFEEVLTALERAGVRWHLAVDS